MSSLAELSDLSQLQVSAVQTGLFWVSAISLISCALVLCSWALNEDLRRFAFNLITLLALCQCGAAAPYTFIIDPAPSSPECTIQSIASQFFGVASMGWIVAISYTLDCVVVKRNLDPLLVFRNFHIAIWGSSVVATLVPWWAGVLGPAGPFCWISNDSTKATIMRAMFFHILLYASLAYHVRIYFRVFRVLRRTIRLLSDSADMSQVHAVRARTAVAA